MKEQFLNIFNSSTPAEKLKFNKRVSAILICLFISLIFWLLIALTKEYTAGMKFRVVYENIPGQKVVVNELPSVISLNVKASGFKILSLRFNKTETPVHIHVDAANGLNIGIPADVLAISTSKFSSDFSSVLGEDVIIQSFVPDSIVFNFSKKISKRVRVIPDLDIHFEKQYDSVGAMAIVPDSVDLFGPGSVIDTIHFISTSHVNLSHVKETVSVKASLSPNKLITLSDTLVRIMVPVERFTEDNLEIPVQSIHVPKGYVLKTFPDKVSVKYQVALSKYNSVSAASFSAIADAEKMNDDNMNKMKVQLVKYPSFLKSVVMDPEKVDYILRKQ
ncbi:MAG: CdaR family protein [Bacteroidetes bacterium]|nr:CdaR family protein [Bacteroidota bacterium]